MGTVLSDAEATNVEVKLRAAVATLPTASEPPATAPSSGSIELTQFIWSELDCPGLWMANENARLVCVSIHDDFTSSVDSWVLQEVSLVGHRTCEARARAHCASEAGTVTCGADGHWGRVARASVPGPEVTSSAKGRRDQTAALARNLVHCELHSLPAPKRESGPSNRVPSPRVPRDLAVAARNEAASSSMQGHRRGLLQHQAAGEAKGA